MTKGYGMFLTQHWLRHSGDHSVWFVVGIFLVVFAWVGLVYYFYMLTWYTWYLDRVAVSICACFCIRLGTVLIAVVLTPSMKLVGLVLCSEIISKSAVTILRHSPASKGIHPTTLFMPWNSSSGEAVGDFHISSEILCSEKKEREAEVLEGVTYLSCP